MKMVLRIGPSPGNAADAAEASYYSIKSESHLKSSFVKSGDARALLQERWHI